MSYKKGFTMLNGKRYTTNYKTGKKSEAKKKAKSIREGGRNAIIRTEGEWYVVYTKK